MCSAVVKNLQYHKRYKKKERDEIGRLAIGIHADGMMHTEYSPRDGVVRCGPCSIMQRS